MLAFDFHVKAGTFSQATVAAELGVVEFDAEEEMSEKRNLPSSVTIKSITEHRDRVRVRAKEGFDVRSEAFRALVLKAWAESPK
ncbi:MAG: hypothetical protein RQ745_10705 [Longimicrobiales bacterium]|nr:hypothetical protein [Longimicrobiales bacterium]